MQCCTDDPDVIYSWQGAGMPPLAADFINISNVTVVAAHAFDGDVAIHSDHANTLIGFSAELSKQFDNDPAVELPEGENYKADICGKPRQEFAIGIIGNYINNYSPVHGDYCCEIRNSDLANETIISIYRAGRDIWVYRGTGAEEVIRLTNAITAIGTPTKIEFRGQINTFDSDDNANDDGWIEFRINGRVFTQSADVEATPVDEPPIKCPTTKKGIIFRDDGPPTGETQASWDRVTFKPMGDISCLYIKERAAYCNDATEPADIAPSQTPDCQAPGPGGSTFDGQPKGPRIMHPGGYGARTYAAPAGGGVSATASDPAEPQSLTGITTPIFTVDITLTNGTVRRASQVGPERTAATWQIARMGPIEYARSDRFGHTKAQTFEIDLADPDGLVRADLEAPATRAYKRWKAQVFAESDAARLAGTARLSCFRGRCVSASTGTPQVVTLTFSDELSYPSSPVSLDRKLPIYAIGDIFRAGATAPGISFIEDAPEKSLSQALPIIFGEASDEWRLTKNDPLDGPVGIVKAIDVGWVLLTGARWRGFALCQYASKGIAISTDSAGNDTPALFGSNSNTDCPASARLDPDVLEDQVILPDSAQLAFPYVDVTYNGLTVRTTMLFARGEIAQMHIDGLVPISVNLWGKETVGDGSGTLITDGAQIVQALFHWAIFQRAKIGNEAMPTFSNGVAKFRTSSAVATTAIHHARVNNGYRGAVIIDSFQAASDWLAQLFVSYDLRENKNHHGQVVLTTENHQTSIAGLPSYTAQLHIRGDSFKTTSERSSELENMRRYDFGPEPATGRLTGQPEPFITQQSVDEWDEDGEPYPGDDMHLIGVYDADVALSVVSQAVAHTRDGITRGEFASDLDLFAKRPGDLIRVTDFRGLGSAGWTERVLMVDGIVLNPNVSDPPQEDDLGVTVRWEDKHINYVAPAGLVGGGVTSDGTNTSRVGFSPVGTAGSGWVVGTAGSGWMVG